MSRCLRLRALGAPGPAAGCVLRCRLLTLPSSCFQAFHSCAGAESFTGDSEKPASKIQKLCRADDHEDSGGPQRLPQGGEPPERNAETSPGADGFQRGVLPWSKGPAAPRGEPRAAWWQRAVPCKGWCHVVGSRLPFHMHSGLGPILGFPRPLVQRKGLSFLSAAGHHAA